MSFISLPDTTPSIKPGGCSSAPDRPSWNDYFMNIASFVASRATCGRRAVGVIFVKDRRILCTGYNGSPPGAPHCIDIGCTVVNGHCVATTHAEANAVAQAAKYGTSIDGATAYITLEPCFTCYKLLVGAGISKIYFRDPYPGEVDLKVASAVTGVVVEQI